MLTLWTYGLPNWEREEIKNMIAAKWGIKYFVVAGCMVTDELMDSVKIHNDSIKKIIEKKYGKDWEDKFEKEIDSELKKQK